MMLLRQHRNWIMVFMCCLVISALCSPVFAKDYLSSIFLFLDDGGPITTAQDIRLSLWSDGRFDDGDVNGAGAIDTGADHYAGYQTVLTVNPDSLGRVNVGLQSLSNFPQITPQNQFLMIEYKDDAAADTSYVRYDDTFINGLEMDRFPLILNGPDLFQELYSNDATTADTFVLDRNDDATDVTLQFGLTLSESIRWDDTNTQFLLSDDTALDGVLDIYGSSLTLDADNTGVGNTVQIFAEQGTDTSGLLQYNATTDRWEINNDGAGLLAIDQETDTELDDAYDRDVDKTLAVDDVAGLTFDLQTTGDVVFQDNGVDFALFRDDALFELTAAEDIERLRLTDQTNADSVGLYTGSGSPDTSLSGESGSLFMDQLGDLYVNDSTGSGTGWNKLLQRRGLTVTVAKRGGDFTTIEAALASITDNSSTNRYSILVYPGVYTENNPLVMKSYVNIEAVGAPRSTKVVAANPTSDLITLATSMQVSNLLLDGVTSGSCLKATSITDVLLINNEVEGCDHGVHVDNSFVVLTGLKHSGGSMDTFVMVENGGRLLGAQMVINGGAPTTAFYSTGVGSSLIIGTSLAATVGLTNGFYVDDGGTIRISATLIQGATNAIRIGSVGSESTFQSSGGVIADSVDFDLLVEASDANVVISGGVLDRNKVEVPVGNDISMIFSDETDENKGTVNLAEFSAGSPENPTESNFGEGDNYTNGMLVYTETSGGVFSDVSDEAASLTGSTLTFPGTAVDNAIYLSSDRTDTQGNLVQFVGFKAFTAGTPLDPGSGSVTLEYWDGSSWSHLHHFCAHELEFYRYGEDCYLRPDSREQVRFDVNFFSNWVANDPPGTGTNRYWVRLRIDTAITTAPVFEQFKIQPNRTEIAGDGTISYFGDARQKKTFIVSPAQIFFGKGGTTPDNASFTIGSGSVTWTEQIDSAAFTGLGNSIEELTGSIALPHGIDTSSSLDARIFWKKSSDAAGDVQWKLDYYVLGVQGVDISNGTNITPAPRADGEDITIDTGGTVETAPEGDTDVEDEVLSSLFLGDINISGHYEGDTIFFRLYRDPADPDDTYTADAIMVGFEVTGLFWTQGEVK